MIETVHFLKALVMFALLLATAIATLSAAEMNGLGSAYAQASATKIIRDDATGGDCASIGRWNATTKTCRLTTELNQTTIQIDSDGITLNGNWHTITGTGSGVGLIVDGRTRVTVINLKVNNFDVGIRLIDSDDNILVRNNVSNNIEGGIFVRGPDNILVRNDASSINAGDGIFLAGSNNTLILNTANSNNGNGISLTRSDNNTLVINTARTNSKFGYFDDSSGSGTAGTANTYITNECSDNVSGGSSPSGLCSPRRR
jgi:parallel beta-helix repeat protein